MTLKIKGVCGDCTNGYSPVSIDGEKHCLTYVTDRCRISEAAAMCAEDGSRLPLPKNSKENSDFANFFKTKRPKDAITDSFALDLNDVKNEGVFVSSTGYKPVFHNWYGSDPSKPDSFNDYVAMFKYGSWSGVNKVMAVSLICQKVCEKKKTNSTSAITTSKVSSLGIVEKCTLPENLTKRFTVDGRTYCVYDNGSNMRSVGEETCSKYLNAKLPLPKNQAEIDRFLLITKKDIWLSISDPGKTGLKANWKDITGKTPSFVKQGYQNFPINKLTQKF